VNTGGNGGEEEWYINLVYKSVLEVLNLLFQGNSSKELQRSLPVDLLYCGIRQ
jgi:hypothetical protein